MRDIIRKTKGDADKQAAFAQLLSLAHGVRHQHQRQRGNKIYSLHALEVECTARGRSAVEPVIGHLKSDHRMDRSNLKGSKGDAINAVLAAAGYNLRRLLAWLRLFLRNMLAAARQHHPEPHDAVAA